MKIGIVKEIMEGESRVALVPDAVAKLVKAGSQVVVESGAGAGAMATDEQYGKAGAAIEDGPGKVYGTADIVPKLQRPMVHPKTNTHEVDLMKEGLVVISLFSPSDDQELPGLLAKKRITFFSMTLIPRTTRAQSMDALSSQSTVAGYKAALIGANSIGKFLPMLTTAAGTISPAKVFVLGAGVAGLMAIATAKRLGAVVEAFDIRPAVKEEVQSLGARFIDVELGAGETQDAGGYAKEISGEAKRREQEVIAKHVAAADVVISTAAVPGKRAPLIITAAMVEKMRPGSLVVDIAAETGGNCELTRPGTVVMKNGVAIHGPVNLPSTMPIHASFMYSRNILAFLGNIMRDDKLNVDFEDDITRATCLAHAGETRSV
jgi:NAD(P) transhydrogenase subunit alpha